MSMFVECNLVKRLDNPFADHASSGPPIGSFAGFIRQGSRPALSTMGTGGNGGQMLPWFEGSEEITGEQRDFLACQGARHALRVLSRRHRTEHFAFQQRANIVGPFLADSQRRRNANIFLNPIRTWRRFTSRALLDEEARTPADVLFFAVRGDIAMAYFGLEGKALLNELSDYQPCPLADWSTHSSCGGHFGLDEFACHLAELGIVSFG